MTGGEGSQLVAQLRSHLPPAQQKLVQLKQMAESGAGVSPAMISNDPDIKAVTDIQRQILMSLKGVAAGPGMSSFKLPEIPDPAKFVGTTGVLDAKGFMAFLKAHQPVDAWTDNDHIGQAIDKGSFEVAAPAAAAGPSMYEENLKDQVSNTLANIPGATGTIPTLVGDPAAKSGLFGIIEAIAPKVTDAKMIQAGAQRVWLTFYQALMADPTIARALTPEFVQTLQKQTQEMVAAVLQYRMGGQA